MQNAKSVGRKKPASGINRSRFDVQQAVSSDAAREVRAEIPPEPYKGISKKEGLPGASALWSRRSFSF